MTERAREPRHEQAGPAGPVPDNDSERRTTKPDAIDKTFDSLSGAAAGLGGAPGRYQANLDRHGVHNEPIGSAGASVGQKVIVLVVLCLVLCVAAGVIFVMVAR